MQDDNPAASTAHDIKAAARDMLRMGSRWAHSALDWIDERRNDMNNRSRDERDFGDRHRYQQSPYASSYGESQDRDRHEHERYRRYGGRSDRDIQSDFSGGGYDQVGSRDHRGGGSDWRGGYGREGSYPQSRTMSPDDDSLRGDYGSDYGHGAGSGGAGYGYGATGAGGVGYGAPGYGAGSSYGGANRYQGDFQDRDWMRESGENYGAYSTGRGADSQYGQRGSSQYGAYAREGRHGQEGYGQSRGGRQQEWRTRGSAGQGYAESGYPYGDYRTQGDASGSQAGLRSGQMGRSYRGIGPRNYTRSDERIREDLNERLTDAHDIDASGLSVEVNNGVATLNGTVSERWMKHRAEDIADGCTGVRDVRNMIQVSSQGSQRTTQSQGSSMQSSGQGAHGASQQGSQSGGSYAQGSSGTTSAQGSSSTGGGGLGASSGSSQYGSGSSGSGSSGSSSASSQHGSTGSTTHGGSGSSRGPNV